MYYDLYASFVNILSESIYGPMVFDCSKKPGNICTLRVIFMHLKDIFESILNVLFHQFM